MLVPLDPAALPKNVIALRSLLLHREDEHAAELQQYVADLTAGNRGKTAGIGAFRACPDAGDSDSSYVWIVRTRLIAYRLPS